MSQETNLNTIFFTNFQNAQRDKKTLYKVVINGIMKPANTIISYVEREIYKRDSKGTHTTTDDTFKINIISYIINEQIKLQQENAKLLASLTILLQAYTAVKDFGIVAAEDDKAPEWKTAIETNYNDVSTMYKHIEPFITAFVHARNESMQIAVNTIRNYLNDYASKRAPVASARIRNAETQLTAGGKQKSRRVKQSRRAKQSRRTKQKSRRTKQSRRTTKKM